MKAIVTFINHNAEKQIKGKACKGIEVTLQGDKATKKEFIPSFNTALYNSFNEVSIGYTLDVKMSKNSVNGKDYWNVAGIEILDKTSTPKAPESPVVTKSFTPYTPAVNADRELSIQRQNVSRTAMDFVIGLLNAGVYGKKMVTPNVVFNEAKKYMVELERYVTLKDDFTSDVIADSMSEDSVSDSDNDLPF